MSKRETPELVMTISATPNEMIALNGTINFYLRHLERAGMANERKEVIQLLEHFQQRLAQQIRPSAAPPSGVSL